MDELIRSLTYLRKRLHDGTISQEEMHLVNCISCWYEGYKAGLSKSK